MRAAGRPTREELFTLVWERPVRDVARELGVSDVALAKRCRQLQVPTPPRGYWQKVRSGGQAPRPPLKAFMEEAAGEWAKPSPLVKLTDRQWEFLKLALSEMAAAGRGTSGCDHRSSWPWRSLGVSPGDDVVAQKRGQAVKMRVEGTWMYTDEGRVSFSLSGKRYRRDGLLGKSDEWLNIEVASGPGTPE